MIFERITMGNCIEFVRDLHGQYGTGWRVGKKYLIELLAKDWHMAEERISAFLINCRIYKVQGICVTNKFVSF